MSVDFAVLERVRIGSRAELVDAFAALGDRPARLAGRATMQDAVPAPARPVVLLDLSGFDRVLRLEPGDLTCSVEPGVPREELAAELARHRLCLPCDEDGATVGGVFARGEPGALAPGGHSARSLILGLEAVLPEGLCFKAGARVVKSVAGFDVQKLFVGARGRMFAVTALHLKLRPLPELAQWFTETGLERARAVTRMKELRRMQHAPAALVLARGADGAFAVHGSLSGRSRVVAQQARALGVALRGDAPRWRLAPESELEVVRGIETTTRLDALLDALPPRAPLTFTGGGRFDVVLAPVETDVLLPKLEALGTRAEVRCGAPARRGRDTGRDARATQLAHDVERALDPRGVLL